MEEGFHNTLIRGNEIIEESERSFLFASDQTRYTSCKVLLVVESSCLQDLQLSGLKLGVDGKTLSGHVLGVRLVSQNSTVCVRPSKHRTNVFPASFWGGLKLRKNHFVELSSLFEKGESQDLRRELED